MTEPTSAEERRSTPEHRTPEPRRARRSAGAIWIVAAVVVIIAVAWGVWAAIT